MKITKRDRQIILMVVLLALAVTSCARAGVYKQEAEMLKRDARSLMLDIAVLEQSVELLKKEIREAPAIPEEKTLPMIDGSTRVDEIITPLESLLEANVPGLTNYIAIDDFVLLATEYRIDPGFALATFILETGWGKSDAWLKHNNPAGLTCNGSYCAYKNKMQGVEEMFRLLRAYADGTIPWIGTRRTVNAVRKKWSTTEDTESIVRIWKEIIASGRTNGI